MKKTVICILLALCLAFSFNLIGCSFGSGSVNTLKDDGDINVFSIAKTTSDSEQITIRMSIGGENVKISGFNIVFTYDKDITIKKVSPSSGFTELTYYDKEGQLSLVWAVPRSVNTSSAVCDITFLLNDTNVSSIRGEIKSLGWYNRKTYAVEDIKGRIADFDLNN